MLSAKQGGIKYHFLSLLYDSTWDWTLVSRTIGEHFTPWVKNKRIITIRNMFSNKLKSRLLGKCFEKKKKKKKRVIQENIFKIYYVMKRNLFF